MILLLVSLNIILLLVIHFYSNNIKETLSNNNLLDIEHESIFNVSGNSFEINVDQILKSKNFSLISSNNFNLCKSDRCDIAVKIGKNFHASLLEMYEEYFNLRMKITINNIKSSDNIVNNKLITASILPDASMNIFFYASPNFKRKYKIRICDKNRMECRYIPWSKNDSEPDIQCKLFECFFITFETV